MTCPTIITPDSLAASARAEADGLQPTQLHTHAPREAARVALRPRADHFRAPRPSLADLGHSGSHASRAGATRHASTRHPTVQPGLPPPPGVVHFTVRPGTDDAVQLRRLGQSLLHSHSGHGDTSTVAPQTPATDAEPRPSLDEARSHISAFRSAMGEYRQAILFGGEDRAHVAHAALDRAQSAFDHLYARLPMTPAMESILTQYRSQIERASGELASLEPHHGRHSVRA